MRGATRLGLLLGTTALALGVAAGTAAADTGATAVAPISVVVGPGVISVDATLDLDLGGGVLVGIPGLISIGGPPLLSIGL